MNILYISNLSGKKTAGLTYSVPAQINSHGEIDNICWYNLNNLYVPSNIGNVTYYDTLKIPDHLIEKLPEPFNYPDIVVFQGFYFKEYCLIAKQLNKKNIPYIIIPRSSLTQEAQYSKKIKKIVGNKLMFNKFAKEAAAIQYLTENEAQSSGHKWNDCRIIIPNGIASKNNVKFWNYDGSNKITGAFIGRLDIYQKGLDLLIEACGEIKDALEGKLEIKIFGNDENGSKEFLNKLINQNKLENIISINSPVFGEDKETQLLNSDFFILTSRFEGHPMGLIEALSYGLPSFVTTDTNMGEEINYNDAGWVSLTNVKGIKHSLIKIVNERNFSAKGKRAFDLSKKYDWNNISNLTSQYYKKIIYKYKQFGEVY